VGRPYEGEGVRPSPAPGSHRGLLRRGRADEDSATSAASPLGAPLPNPSRLGVPNPSGRIQKLASCG
jgi:hypothetical protein